MVRRVGLLALVCQGGAGALERAVGLLCVLEEHRDERRVLRDHLGRILMKYVST